MRGGREQEDVVLSAFRRGLWVWRGRRGMKGETLDVAVRVCGSVGRRVSLDIGRIFVVVLEQALGS